MFVGFEVATAVSMLIVLVVQAPHVAMERVRVIDDEAEIERRTAIAKEAELEFGRRHVMAQFVLYKAGGFLLWVGGLCIVLVSIPRALSPDLLNSLMIGLGLMIQFVASVLFIFWALRASRYVSRALRSSARE